MKNFKVHPIVIAALLAGLGATAQTHAAAIATDNAADPAYNTGWPDGANGGSGFSAWTFNPTINSGEFIGDSSGNGDPPSGDINTNGRAFGLFANSGGRITASRSFTSGGPNNSNTLGVGQMFSLQMDNGFVDSSTNGFVGFNLLDSNFLTQFQFGFFGGQNVYVFEAPDGAGEIHTNIPFTTDGLTAALLLGDNNTYTFTVTLNGGAQYVLTGTGAFGAINVSMVQLFNQTAGSGSSHDLFFNDFSLTTVPEPGATVLVLVGAGIAAAAVRGRRAGSS